MIIQSLVEKYQILAQSQIEDLPLAGWSVAKVSYAIPLKEDGSLSGELMDIRGKLNNKSRPQSLVVPEQAKRTSQVLPFFLVDNATYLLGIDTKNKPEKARESFLAAKSLHEEILQDVDSPAARAILNFFQKWDVEKAEKDPNLKVALADLKKGANLVFFFETTHVYHIPEIIDAWEVYLGKNEATDAFCSITGENDTIARLHPSIKGVQGAQSSGASLVSFNAEAYNSFGKEQGMNAPIGEKAAFEYTAALNYLLKASATHKRIEGTTLVFWANKKSDTPSEIIKQSITGFDESRRSLQQDEGMSLELSQTDLSDLMEKLSKGEAFQHDGEMISPNTPVYILGLSPNAARLSIRFFAERQLGVFVTNLMAHQERLTVVKPAYEKEKKLGIDDLLNAVISDKSRDKKAADLLGGELLRSILMGREYPRSLITMLSTRIKADRKMTSTRAAILKAYYLKNRHPQCPEEVLQVELNKEATNIPYLLGRAFAVLENIQWSANAKVGPGPGNKKSISMNKTIGDKYFYSAAATPSRIFPVLIDLSRHHLSKLNSNNPVASVRLQAQLTEIMGELGAKDLPNRLSLPERGSFQLGYFFQKQDDFKQIELKKAEKKYLKGEGKDE